MTGSGIVEGEVRDNSTINIQCLPLSTLILALGNPRLVIILYIYIAGNIGNISIQCLPLSTLILALGNPKLVIH